MQQAATSTSLTLDEVKQHFEHWRATREKRCKIPDFLWDEVKSLMGRYATNQITQTLGVNAYQISTGINNNKDKPDITFVRARTAMSSLEAIKPNLSSLDEEKGTCSFEIHRPNGGVLKISQFPLVSLASIINQFMEQ
jgi:hypothetical protein